MVAGTWFNNDGLYVQYGTQKAVPEVGGDYLAFGDVREFEQLIPLVPMVVGTGGQQIPAPPTSFSGTTTAAAAGIQSLTTQFPLQITAPQVTTSGGILTLTNPQLFIEQVTVETLIAATGGTSISIGLATQNPGTPSTFVQITPNAGVQILNTFLTASMAAAGQRVDFYQAGSTESFPAATAGGGTWLGTVPLVTNAITPLPTQAYISTIAAGAFTNGLIKLRIRYNFYGSINQ